MTSWIRRPGLLSALLTVAAVAVLVTGLTATVRANQSRQAARSVREIAAKVELLPGSTPYSGVSTGCPAAEYVRCGRVDLDVDTAARQMQAVLSGVAEEQAGRSCLRLPNHGDLVWLSCTVRVDRHGHTVMILIDPAARRSAGRVVLTGAEVRIQAD